MAAKRSAGLLLYRLTPTGPEVLLVHPGGPLWVRREDGAWSLPKGELEPGEDPCAAAVREFAEELGVPAPVDSATLVPLGSVRQRGGKLVEVWVAEGDLDVSAGITSATFTMEWPPRSGRMQEFPEVDRAAWLSLAVARVKLVSAQAEFLDRLQALLGRP